MALEREREQLEHTEVDPKLYYDYEGRFIKQRLERDHMRMLPRVVKPAMFAESGHALGDVSVFERFTVGPVSALTCREIELEPAQATPKARRIPTTTLYVLEGDGTSIQNGEKHEFTAGDVVIVPPYTEHCLVAGDAGLRAWVPETRFWHVLGLLWHEHLEPHDMPEGVTATYDADGKWTGYDVAGGMLGLQEDLYVPAGPDPRRAEVFEARRAVRDEDSFQGDNWYDELLRQLPRDNQREDDTPRVVHGADCAWEDTRGGRMKFFVTNWSDVSGQDVDLALYEIPPGGRTGKHRHIAEELLLVLEGSGYEDHDGTRHPFEAGDLICTPPMTAHQHVNTGNETVRLLSAWSHHPAHERLGGIQHIEDAASGSSA
ncbi:MAG: cupin domain-containing protein [Actinomycetota bacterium]|nr:cupin domain-containing protein [Actinomycetota bacterium]